MNRMHPMTDTQLASLREAAALAGPRETALVTLMTQHAMRASEVTGLKVSAVNFKDDTLSISRLKGSVSKVERMTPDTRAALAAWLAVKPAGEYLFPGSSTRGTGQLSRQQLYNIFRGLAEAAGIPATSRAPHSARHTIGQTLAEKGATMQLIQAVMGHKNANSTAQYFELRQSSVDEQKAKLLGLQAA
jgi:integrase/recombinase XerD